MPLKGAQFSKKILLISENVRPQVNGIARRIGHYHQGLLDLGHDVDILHPESGRDKCIPYVNPYNFTARMMIILPTFLYQLVTNSSYDIVHVVMPLNISGMWILAAFKAKQYFRNESSPTLVISWHCNMVDYVDHFCKGNSFLRWFTRLILFRGLFAILPTISDRILSPTKSTDPDIINLWEGRNGVCHAGIDKASFSPNCKESSHGLMWQNEKIRYLRENGCESLLVCVGRLSLEKGVDELIKCLPLMKHTALWLVGDGPHRPNLELLADKLQVPVKFFGYQKGDALHSVYTVADCFVCPSLTETFGQTVNEALASHVRVALPRVPVFEEAYQSIIPDDAFWDPLDRQAMVSSILLQLKKNPSGISDVKLRNWSQACKKLDEEYKLAQKGHRPLRFSTIVLALLIWFPVTIFCSLVMFCMVCITTFFWGSVRIDFSTLPRRIQNKLKQSSMG